MHMSGPSAIRSVNRPSRQTPITGSRRPGRSRTSRSADCARRPTSSPRPFSSRRPRRRPTSRSDVSTRGSATPSSGRPTRSSAARCAISSSSTSIRRAPGTSHNMNANEVLANRAAELLGGARGEYRLVHPERSRQHGTVDQRRVPDGDAAGAAARRTRRWWSRRARSSASLAKKARGVRVHPQGRPHASAGRGADDARPGVQRLRRLRRARRRRRRHAARRTARS